jgi:hypothetical protein
VKKLRKEMVVAVDFDGVLADQFMGRWQGHNVLGPPKRGAAKYLNKLWNEGWIIIIWTTRPRTNNLLNWLKRFGIKYNTINRDVLNWYGHLDHKIFAHVFLEDKDVKSIGKKWKWWKTYWRIRWGYRHMYGRDK